MDQSIILAGDPRILAVPILENHEPLIDLVGSNDILFGPSPEIENNLCYTKMRSTVYQKLLQAQKQLPSGVRLCVYEALRTLKLQKQLFEEMLKNVKTEHPTWPEKRIFEETTRLVASVTTFEGKPVIPAHTTGAAVDVYLVDSETHLPVEIGILIKD